MKTSFQKLTGTFGNLSAKIIFSSQLAAVLLSLPLLYTVGVSHHSTDKKANQFIIMTNKGKKIIVTASTYDYKKMPVANC
jgi:hypothetical protein